MARGWATDIEAGEKACVSCGYSFIQSLFYRKAANSNYGEKDPSRWGQNLRFC